MPDGGLGFRPRARNIQIASREQEGGPRRRQRQHGRFHFEPVDPELKSDKNHVSRSPPPLLQGRRHPGRPYNKGLFQR